jgi:hypothetical protein
MFNVFAFFTRLVVKKRLNIPYQKEQSQVPDSKYQGCGSGLDLDSVTSWIRIRIGNPDPGARKLRNFSGKMHLLVIFFLNLPLIRYKIALTTF